MSISSVSSASGSVYSSLAATASSGGSDDIAQLEKQKTALEQELQKVKQSKEDKKTREQEVKQLQQQIQQIEKQIQQKKAQNTGQSEKVGQPPAPSDAQSGKASGSSSATGASDTAELLKKSAAGSKIDVQV